MASILSVLLAFLLTANLAALSQTTDEIKAAVPNHPRQVIKHGKHFLVMDETGLLPADSNIGCGLYCDDTRYLKTWDILLNGNPLTLLYANTSDGYAGKFVYSNKASPARPDP